MTKLVPYGAQQKIYLLMSLSYESRSQSMRAAKCKHAIALKIVSVCQPLVQLREIKFSVIKMIKKILLKLYCVFEKALVPPVPHART